MRKSNVFNEVEGKFFGRWKVLSYAGIDSGKNSLALCRCECGTEKTVPCSKLRAGTTLSCGCHRHDHMMTHKMSGSPEHQAWKNIRQRTTNPKRPDYKRYGGSGVKMCKEWLESFEAFYEHLGPRPSSKHSIDRIDSSKGYEPGNVRWADAFIQANNTKKNVFITHDGKTMTVAQWARELGMNPLLIASRIRRGWSKVKAITEPLRKWPC